MRQSQVLLLCVASLVLVPACIENESSPQPRQGNSAASTQARPDPTDFDPSSLTPEHLVAAQELQGEWTVVSFHRNGRETPVAAELTIPYTIKGNRMITVGPFNATVEIEYRVDPTKELKHFDQRFTGGRIGPWIAKGVYNLDGDILTLCYGDPNVPRPTEFTARSGDGRRMQVYKRISR